MSWRKFGFDYGWRLSMVLAGWFPPEDTPDYANLEEAQKMVAVITPPEAS